MESIDVKVKQKNVYLRFLLNILSSKYHVGVVALATSAEIVPSKLLNFKNDKVNLSRNNLEKLENYMIDLYSPILDDELLMHKSFVEDIVQESELKTK